MNFAGKDGGSDEECTSGRVRECAYMCCVE